MTKKNRLIAGLLAMTVLFVMLSSVIYIAVESGHDCSGEDCPICYHISICANTLKSVGLIAAAVTQVVLIGIFDLSLLSSARRLASHTTLVSLKVKLSN